MTHNTPVDTPVCWPIELARVLAMLTIITVATNTVVFTMLFDFFSENSLFSCPRCFFAIYSFLFFVTPFFALVGLLFAKPWGFIGLFIFPLVAIIFEVPAIPFIGLILSTDKIGWFNFVILTNIITVLLVWFLFRKYCKITGNKSLFT